MSPCKVSKQRPSCPCSIILSTDSVAARPDVTAFLGAATAIHIRTVMYYCT
jgi:hypothetical protein